MDLQQIVVPDPYPAILHQPFCLPDDRCQVRALENIVAPTAPIAQLTDQIRGGVLVIPDHQRIDLLLRDQLPDPLDNVAVVHEVVPGLEQEPAPDVGPVRYIVPRSCLLDLLSGHVEPRKHVQDPVALDYKRGTGQIRSAGQVDTHHCIASCEVVDIQRIRYGLLDRSRIQPGLRAVLLYAAVLAHELSLLAQALFSNRNLLQQIIDRNTHAKVRV